MEGVGEQEHGVAEVSVDRFAVVACAAECLSLEADQRGGVCAPETVLAWGVVERDAVSVAGQFGDGVVDREASRVALRERVERSNELDLEVVFADPRECPLVRFRAALEACCLECGDDAIDVFGACAGVDVAGGAQRDVASVQRDGVRRSLR